VNWKRSPGGAWSRPGRWRRTLAAATVALAAGPALAAPADGKVVRSLNEVRNEDVVRQQWDLSCGAAAIATLLTFQLGRPVSERAVALALLRRTSPALVRARLGFSLLDLKIYAATQGVGAAGYGGLSLADLDELAPAIVPLRQHGFDHFVVYRGRAAGRVLVADPAFGNRIIAEDAFLAAWATRVGFTVFDPAYPHAPNRMGAPAELFLAPGAQARRAAVAGGPSIDVRQVGSAS
jgi:uncharacterized protein